MNPENPEIRAMARWLIGGEAADLPAEEKPLAVVRVFDRLHHILFPLIGAFGYRALLSRAIKLAAAKNPLLANAQVDDSGTLVIDDLLKPETQIEPTEIFDGAEALLMEFFELLFSLIGVSLALRLVRGSWPDAPFNEIDPKIEERS